MKNTSKKVGAFTGLSLQNSELRYRRLFEAAQDGILILDAGTGLVEDVNPYLIIMLGYTRTEFIKKKLWEVGAFKDVEASKDAFEALQENEYIRYDDLPLKAKGGWLVPVEFVSNVYMVGNEKVIQCNIREITERKRADAALRESEKRYHELARISPVGIFRTDQNGNTIYVNPKWSQISGLSFDEALGVGWQSAIYPDDKENLIRGWHESTRLHQASYSDYRFVHPDGTIVWVMGQAVPEINSENQFVGYVGTITDITPRKQAEERIKRQLEHLTALSGIDRVISANFDLRLSLAEILHHVTIELGIDAADILILNSSLNMLEYGAESGFRTNAVKKVQIRLGESLAGRAALEGQLIQIPNLKDESHNSSLKALLKDEDFVCYFGVPLVIKGQVKGVLEIFHRTALEPDAEWFDFLDSLAGQAAIAVEIATLFENLQRSNSNLFLAYDATIEGWSQALDLRDKETEGHSKRVAEMAVKLARLFGLSEADLVQVRWGSLLHDIGKMGVSDGILLKAGPLTNEEWIVMKKHPTFAFELLAPIDYLRQALDIPYCHHEKWDGSGYPRGLKGTQIPLMARIFALVDVWDALKSNRPYRPAWSEKDVLESIRSLSGTHFDPKVVDAFLSIPG